jgi:hypothetical protein
LLSVNALNPQSWNRYNYVLNNPLKYLDPNGLWELDFRTMIDKKTGKAVSQVYAVWQEGDDGAKLAKQLGLKGKEAAQLAKSVGTNTEVRLSALEGTTGKVFQEIEKREVYQAEYTGANGGPEHSDCSHTAAEIHFPGENFMNDNGTNTMDLITLPNRTGPISAGNAMAGDFVRYADKANAGQHFANFIFFNYSADGTPIPIVYSKSGKTGPYEYGPAASFQGMHGASDYGTIRGIQEGQSGYYR